MDNPPVQAVPKEPEDSTLREQDRARAITPDPTLIGMEHVLVKMLIFHVPQGNRQPVIISCLGR